MRVSANAESDPDSDGCTHRGADTATKPEPDAQADSPTYRIPDAEPNAELCAGRVPRDTARLCTHALRTLRRGALLRRARQGAVSPVPDRLAADSQPRWVHELPGWPLRAA